VTITPRNVQLPLEDTDQANLLLGLSGLFNIMLTRGMKDTVAALAALALVQPALGFWRSRLTCYDSRIDG
jgi:hypothetical protein